MIVRATRRSGPIGRRPTRRLHDFGHPHGAAGRSRTFMVCVFATIAAIACIVFPPTSDAATAPPAAAMISLR